MLLRVPAGIVLLVHFLFAAGVTVRFDPASPDVGPFPTDFLTVPDAAQKTGLRVNLPLPDCNSQPSLCQEIAFANLLDGFNLQPRIAVRFSAAINPDTLRAGVVFIALDNLTSEEFGLQRTGDLTPINRVIYDPATQTAYAKPDSFFDQHRRYGLIVTDAVRDRAGDAVGADPAFLGCVAGTVAPRREYCDRLAQMVNEQAARFAPRKIVAASIFTTLSATAWLEKARAQIQQAPVTLSRPGGKSVFPVASLNSLVIRQQTGVSPPAFQDLTLPPVIFTGIDRIVFGSYPSPNFLNDQQLIDAGPTGGGVPLPTASNDIAFHVFLPGEAKPAHGYPVVIFAHGITDSSFGAASLTASSLARTGLALIAINAVGHGFGPLSKVVITENNGTVTEIPSGGRGVDLNGDGIIDSFEGCGVLPIAGFRDCFRQTALDLMQLVRLIRSGVDLDGDGTVDLDPNRIYLLGHSLGALYGTIVTAVEPDIRGAVFNSGGGPVADITQTTQTFGDVAAVLLAQQTPPLLNLPGGFDGNYVLRYQPALTNSVPGAIPIQNIFELGEWVQAPADPVSYATHLSSSTLPGVPIKPVLWQFAKGDRTVPNPTATNLVRAANMRESTQFYRHDLARAAVPQLDINPHIYLVDISSLLSAAIALSVQGQAAIFFATDGVMIADLNPVVSPLFGGRDLFETPAFLPEDFSFLPVK